MANQNAFEIIIHDRPTREALTRLGVNLRNLRPLMEPGKEMSRPFARDTMGRIGTLQPIRAAPWSDTSARPCLGMDTEPWEGIRTRLEEHITKIWENQG